jgi:hypothetical protein
VAEIAVMGHRSNYHEKITQSSSVITVSTRCIVP